LIGRFSGRKCWEGRVVVAIESIPVDRFEEERFHDGFTNDFFGFVDQVEG